MVPGVALPVDTRPGIQHPGLLPRKKEGGAKKMPDGGAESFPVSSLPYHSSVNKISCWEVHVVRTGVGSDKESQISLLRLSGILKQSLQKALPVAQAARIGGQHQRNLARPGSQSPGQGMRQFLSQVPRILTALPFVCVSGFCSPSSQSLLRCQLGLLPPPQLFLYIWSQEGALELPGGLELSCVPGFLGNP